jgi:ligand-binding sensor domain-containing protein
MKNFLIALFYVLIVSFGYSQKVQLFNKENSTIPEDDLLSIAIDGQGNKWIGSAHSGLLVFDGESYTTFSEMKGDFFTPIFKDSKGNMWVSFSAPVETVGSVDVLARYDGSGWWWYKAEDIGPYNISVTDICEGKDGTLYFAGPEGFLVMVKDNKWNLLELPEKDMVALSVAVSDDGVIALGFGRPDCGLLIYQDGKWKSYSEKGSPLVINVVRALKFTNNGSLIVGYGGGFGDGGFSVMKGKKWTHFNKSNSGISDHMVRDIEFDGKNYWMATNNGLVKFDGKKVSSVFFREGMFKNVINEIAIENGTLWITTNFGLIKYIP